MIRRFFCIAVLPLILCSEVFVSCTTAVAQDDQAVNKLIESLPKHFSTPVALLPKTDVVLRQQVAFELLNRSQHPLCAMLTLLDAAPNGALSAGRFRDYLGPRSCERLGAVLLERSSSADDETRTKASELLDALPYPAVLTSQQLESLLIAGHPSARSQACKLLAQTASTGAISVEKMQKMVTDESPKVRRAAIDALRRLGATKSLTTIRQRIADSDFDVRLAAVLALGSLDPNDASCPELLSRMYREASDDTKKRIVQYLSRLGPRSIAFTELWKDQIRDARELTTLSAQLEELGPDVVRIFVDLLAESESVDTRWSALVLLQWTKHNTSAAIPLVADCLRGSSLRLQMVALSTHAAMGNLRVEDVSPFVTGSDGLRIVAANALAKVTPADRELAVESLRALLDDPNPKVQLAARLSLDRLGVDREQRMKQLTLMLAPSSNLKTDATLQVINLLKERGPDAAIATPLLILALSRSELQERFSLLHPAGEALVAIGKPAVPRLIKSLNHKDLEVRRRVVDCLQRIDDPRAAEGLAERVWYVAMNPHLDDYHRFDAEAVHDGTALEELKADTSPLPVRLAKLLTFPRYAERALDAIARMGPNAKAALPGLSKFYEDLQSTIPRGDNVDRVAAARFQLDRMRLRAAHCIYRVSLTQKRPLFREVEQLLLSIDKSGFWHALSSEGIQTAFRLQFRSQTVVNAFRKLHAQDFASPQKRAIFLYVLAVLDSENPAWRRSLEAMAVEKKLSAKYASEYLELMKKSDGVSDPRGH